MKISKLRPVRIARIRFKRIKRRIKRIDKMKLLRVVNAILMFVMLVMIFFETENFLLVSVLFILWMNIEFNRMGVDLAFKCSNDLTHIVWRQVEITDSRVRDIIEHLDEKKN